MRGTSQTKEGITNSSG